MLNSFWHKVVFFSLLSVYLSTGVQGETQWDDEDEDESSLDHLWVDESTEDDTALQKAGFATLLQPGHFTYRHEAAYGIDSPGQWVTNRSSLRMQWEKGIGNHFIRFDAKTHYDFIYRGDDYPDNVTNKYRHQSRVRELYWQTSQGPLSVKLGRQLVVWGKADGAVVTDIMSPRDLTESVFTSVENARLGQDMWVTDYYYQGAPTRDGTQSQHQWSLVVTPFVKVNELPLPGHPYGESVPSLDPANLPAVVAGDDLHSLVVSNRSVGKSWRRPEVGLRWGVSSEKFDGSLMLAEVNEDIPVLSFRGVDLSQAKIRLDAEYPRYQMLGGGFNWGQGAFVWKGEAAFKKNRSFNRLDTWFAATYSVWDVVLGVDYDANGAYTLSLELSNQHILSWDESIAQVRRDETIAYGVLSKNWWNDTLTTSYTTMFQWQDSESFHRIECIYEMNDQWTVELQVDYFASRKASSVLGRMKDSHRIAVQLDFDF